VESIDKPELDENLLEEGFALPGREDELFVASGSDWWNTAHINHGSGDRWSVYANGYKDAADIVVDRINETQRHQDFLVYPVMYLYRQYLELMIKNLIRHAWMLLDEQEHDPLDSHDIKRYWTMCCKLLDRVSPDDSTTELRHIGRLIEEFCMHDPSSFAFRYPVSKPDKQSGKRRPNLTALKQVNLRNVQEVMRKIDGLLAGAEAQIDHYLDLKADMIASLDSDMGY
jgi:hypothetical protein